MTISTCYDCSERVDRESMHLIKASTLSGRALICDRCHIAEVDRVTAVNLSIQAKLKRARKAAEERYGDRGETPLTAGAVRNARTDAFIAGYLWHAAQQPTLDVDELVVVLHDAACVCDRTTHPAESWVNWTNYARAVVAHLTKGDESDE